ncbi:MAG: class I SAM-dependent methyltransferase [Candidatus Micrarchaeales archaeon]|nr:class I SAM-dependent methyltransferase [Candidatus Micrarchaeales archaeon]
MRQLYDSASNEQMLYRKLAGFYEKVYSWKDYRKDAAILKGIIARNKRSDGNELLEVGCGTGRYLEQFNRSFSCTGIDISRNMLKIARAKRLRNVKLVEGDMVRMELGKKFDVVLCLFGVLPYVKTYSNLRKVIRNFANHMKRGGVLIVDPWYTTTDGKRNRTKYLYEVGMPYMATYDSKELKIARLRIPRRIGYRQIMDNYTLIAEKGDRVRYFIDRYEVGLFEIKRVLGIMKEYGIAARFQKDAIGHGIYIGTRS